MQFTPDPADWTFLNEGAICDFCGQDGQQVGHDPDGMLWITADQWKEAEWDGTPYNPELMTMKELMTTICPNYPTPTVRGVRELFYKHNPFADNVHPTKAEVDNWHYILLNHLRALFGIEDRIEPDHCCFITATWGTEREKTTKWDQNYPSSAKPADYSSTECWGPCNHPATDSGGCNGHCGGDFFPSDEDQAQYLPDGLSSCGEDSWSAECMFGIPVTYPWSVRMLNSFCDVIETEGWWGGHMGPFWRRSKFGFDFYAESETGGDSGWQGSWRANFGGELLPFKYTSCDPSTQGECQDSTDR